MSDKVSKLKIQKVIKEHDYLKSEYDYITELSNISDPEFMTEVNEYLSKNTALKEIYETKENKIIDDNFNKVKDRVKGKINASEEAMEEEPELPKKKSKKSKYLYRQIVKETHPDKIDDERLKELYIKATDSYNEDDAASLYAICDELNISFGVNEDDLMFFEQNIVRVKGEIEFVKTTYAYKWSQTTSEKAKHKLIIDFVKLKVK